MSMVLDRYSESVLGIISNKIHNLCISCCIIFVPLKWVYIIYNIYIFCSSRSARPPRSSVAHGRLPAVTAWYEGRGTPNLFILGTSSHSRDYRMSAGGFIHGFRYTGSFSMLGFLLATCMTVICVEIMLSKANVLLKSLGEWSYWTVTNLCTLWQ